MEIRARIYGLLSQLFVAPLAHPESVEEGLLAQLGEETPRWFASTPTAQLQEALSADFAALFGATPPPTEQAILHGKLEPLTGLQNPVMAFYYQSGYELTPAASTSQAPDHLSVELGFMERLVLQQDLSTQYKFLKHHLAYWAPPYLIAQREAAQTPFYRELCDFTTEYLISEICLTQELLRSC